MLVMSKGKFATRESIIYDNAQILKLFPCSFLFSLVNDHK